MAVGDVRVIVNPERAGLPLDDITAAADAEVARPSDAGDIGDAARQAVDEGVDVVAAVGGDGTQRTVAEAVAGTDTDLAIVPGGTVNLLARVLGVRTTGDAADALRSGDVRVLDLGRCDGTAFVLNSSSGYDADVIDRTSERAKRFGRIGFVAVGVRELVRARPTRCRVTIDGQVWFHGQALTVLVMNVGQRGSADFTLAPDARPDDGRLDVVVVRASRWGMVRAGVARARGRVPRPADAIAQQGRRIDVEWKRDVVVQCDGDVVGRRSRVRYSVEPGAVRVRVP